MNIRKLNRTDNEVEKICTLYMKFHFMMKRLDYALSGRQYGLCDA